MYLPALRLFNETGGFNDSGHASLLSAKLNSDFPCRSEKEWSVISAYSDDPHNNLFQPPSLSLWTLSKILQNPANISGLPEDGNAK